MRPTPRSFWSRFVFAFLALGLAVAEAADKNILLVAGRQSHGPGDHEFNAGMLLLQKCLAGVPGLKTEFIRSGGPISDDQFKNADAIIVYSDGQSEGAHPALNPANMERFGAFAARGGGIGFVHYAVEPMDPKGRPEFLRWIGGYFEVDYSVNPHWTAEFKPFPNHPIMRGVKPFAVRDEWYFNMRFVDDMKGVTPLLVAVPPADTMARKDGKHEGNPHVREKVARGEAMTLSWAFDRPSGGRGFGFTGGHSHQNWGNDDFRKLVLNATLWLAKMDVPANGVSSSVSADDLAANLDPKPPRRAPAPAPAPK
jgi:hypothetical protein